MNAHTPEAGTLGAVSPVEAAKSVFEWISKGERLTDHECLNLYAGTNIQSQAVRQAMATTMNSRPSLGDPGDKYETGLAWSDEIERGARTLLAAALRARFVEYRVLSGSFANLAAVMSATSPGDAVFALPPSAAAHATHHAEGAAGLYGLEVHSIPLVPGTHLLDWGAFGAALAAAKPRLVIVGSSLPLIPIDLPRLAGLCHGHGARLMYDGAHVAGLIAGGVFQQPLQEGADLLTASTYKTFGGPAGGVVATNDADLAERIRTVVYPGLTANFDMARVAATAVAAAEQLHFGPAYARQCLSNAQRLAAELTSMEIPVWRPGGQASQAATASHLIALDARPFGGGTSAARAVEPANVLFSGIPLPIDAPPGDYAGIRLGVQELTRWGMDEEAMSLVADLLARALTRPEDAPSVRRDVITLRREFATVRYGWMLSDLFGTGGNQP